MQTHILFCLLVLLQGQTNKPPMFGNDVKQQGRATQVTPPLLTPPAGYRPVQVPDYVADTYMKFATTETAHDYQIADVTSRVAHLEEYREKNDRPDIDSLKETRTKALVYFAIATTAVSIVWGLLAALLGYLFKAYIAPRLMRFWELLGAGNGHSSYPLGQGIALNASDDEDRTA
jgi:hypothetical protein